MLNPMYDITIEYCVPWDYSARTVSAVQDLMTNYQHVIGNIVIKTGTKGAFEVTVNDDLIYSKKTNGRHAEPGEILQLFKNVVGSDVATYPQSK